VRVHEQVAERKDDDEVEEKDEGVEVLLRLRLMGKRRYQVLRKLAR
jgi:hypothetical protein